MKHKWRHILQYSLVILLIFSTWITIDHVYAAGKQKTAQDVVDDMGVGWNLGNSLDAYSYDLGYVTPERTEKLWDNPLTTKQLINTVADAGFGSIRIPVTYVNHIDDNGNIDKAWLKRIAQIVNYALDNDLYVIINVHHDTGHEGWICADADTYKTDVENLLNIWKQVAAYFKNYSDKLLFESTNEILNTNNNWDWNTAWKDFRVVHDMNQQFINTIRKTGGKNKNRYLVMSTWGASSDSCQIEQMFYKKFKDTAKDRLILSVHNYMSSESSIDTVITSLESYSKKYDIPIIIDEFGTNSRVESSTRISSAEYYVKTAKKAGITCFWWDNGSDFALLNRHTYKWKNKTLVDALVNSVQ